MSSIISILHAGFSAKRKSFRDMVTEFRLHGVDTVQDKLNAEIARRFETKAKWNAYCKEQWDINDAGANFRKAKSTYAYAVEHGLPIVDEENNVILTTNAVVEHKKAATPTPAPAQATTDEGEAPVAEPQGEVTPEENIAAIETAINCMIESGHEQLVKDMLNRVDVILRATDIADKRATG